MNFFEIMKNFPKRWTFLQSQNMFTIYDFFFKMNIFIKDTNFFQNFQTVLKKYKHFLNKNKL